MLGTAERGIINWRRINVEMICSECNQIQDSELKEKKTTTGIYHLYLQCVRCHVKTTCFVTDKRTRKLINENKALREKENKSQKEFEQVEINDKEIQKKMDELKDRYGF